MASALAPYATRPAQSAPRTWCFGASHAALLAVATTLAAEPTPGEGAPVGRKTEVNIVPLVGGDSDVGIGVGQFSSLARLEPGFDPYRWRIESAAFITFRRNDGSRSTIELPRQDYFVGAIIPEIGPGRRYRLEVRPSYTRETTLKYFGLGNASSPPSADASRRVGQYQRTHPTLLVSLRRDLSKRFAAQAGGRSVVRGSAVLRACPV